MGNDGGSIPTRIELVREAVKEASTTTVKAAKRERLEYGWTTDPLSRRLLAAPIVSDCGGILYRKESVIEYLLQLAGGINGSGQADENGDGGDGDDDNGGDDKFEIRLADSQSVVQGRIKSLKDVVEVKFQEKEPEHGRVDDHGLSGPRWICPLSQKELGPGVKAVYLVPCGHAFAAAAIKEVESQIEGKCPECDSDYSPLNVIPILPTDQTDIDFLKTRSQTLSNDRQTHSLKKGEKKKKKDEKKQKKRVRDGPDDADADDRKCPRTNNGESNHRTARPGQSGMSSLGNIQNAATAAVTAKVIQEHDEMKKRRTGTQSKSVTSLFSQSGRDELKRRTNNDFMTRGFTMSK